MTCVYLSTFKLAKFDRVCFTLSFFVTYQLNDYQLMIAFIIIIELQLFLTHFPFLSHLNVFTFFYFSDLFG